MVPISVCGAGRLRHRPVHGFQRESRPDELFHLQRKPRNLPSAVAYSLSLSAMVGQCVRASRMLSTLVEPRWIYLRIAEPAQEKQRPVDCYPQLGI